MKGIRGQHVKGDGESQNNMLGFSYDVFIRARLG